MIYKYSIVDIRAVKALLQEQDQAQKRFSEVANAYEVLFECHALKRVATDLVGPGQAAELRPGRPYGGSRSRLWLPERPGP